MEVGDWRLEVSSVLQVSDPLLIRTQYCTSRYMQVNPDVVRVTSDT